MLSYGATHLHLPAPAEVALIASLIPLRDAFAFFRPRWQGDPSLDPRPHLNWFLNRPFKLNCFFHPWSASRWGYAFVLADAKMHKAITAQNETGGALMFKMDDDLGAAISTPLYMLPPVPLTKLKVKAGDPQLPLFLLPLVDERYRWWERGGEIEVEEGTTTWEEVYEMIAAALGITLNVDPVHPDYLFPGEGLSKNFQPLPLLLDLVASSVGQRVVRTLDGNFHTRNASTGNSLQIAQANLYRKYAGGSLALGVVDA